MQRASLLASVILLVALSACQTAKPALERPDVTVTMEEEPAWRKVATPDDLGRIERLPSAWSEALADARKGFSKAVNSEGDLLKPDAGLPRASPPPGSYRCRVIKIGALKAGARAFTAHKPFFCHIGVSQDQLSITKQTGTQRPGGYLWDTEKTSRMIFLGSMALGNEDVPLPYGQNPGRDMAGVFERYGDYRYRLVVPWPRQDSKLDVFEFIPLVPQPE